MQVFLERLESDAVRQLYLGLDETWNSRVQQFNSRMRFEDLPLRAANLSSVWTICYTTPSRYHWMLQYYLREQGLALSWIGTGRLIFSLNYSAADFAAVLERFVLAARRMAADGWWWHPPGQTDRAIRRSLLLEMLTHRF
jgi:glutamate-1-semialdehyde 2,1-aminomutase